MLIKRVYIEGTVFMTPAVCNDSMRDFVQKNFPFFWWEAIVMTMSAVHILFNLPKSVFAVSIMQACQKIF